MSHPMKSKTAGPSAGNLTGARVAVLGYGAGAREYAMALAKAGNVVSVGMRNGGMSWVRARKDGFTAAPASAVIEGAGVVVVLVPDDEQASVYWHAIEPHLAPDTLLVFGRGLALQTGHFDPLGSDVVLVTGEREGGRATCRVAVRHDATGRALERAIAYARSVFGDDALVGTTTLAAEAALELAALESRAGGMDALLDDLERTTARVRDTHAPEEARLAFYDGLRALIERGGSTRLLRVAMESATTLSDDGPRRERNKA
jgi:ketol-acid reductoisomerase